MYKSFVGSLPTTWTIWPVTLVFIEQFNWSDLCPKISNCVLAANNGKVGNK